MERSKNDALFHGEYCGKASITSIIPNCLAVIPEDEYGFDLLLKMDRSFYNKEYKASTFHFHQAKILARSGWLDFLEAREVYLNDDGSDQIHLLFQEKRDDTGLCGRHDHGCV